MRQIRLDAIARRHLREIHEYSLSRWGADQADAYILGLSRKFEEIASRKAISRPIPALYGVDGRFCRCAEHLIYWRPIGDDAIAIVAILYQRMHQPGRVKAAFDRSG